MTIFVEGVDNVGKGTQIEKIQSYLQKKFPDISVFYAHCSNIKAWKGEPDENKLVEYASRNFYERMFHNVVRAAYDTWWIYDRAHLGEFVYSPIYRQYDGDYVFDLEKENAGSLTRDSLLILFTASAETVIKRDDGLSFSTKLQNKQNELALFDAAFEKSIIPKIRIDITDKSIDQVWAEVQEFLDAHTKED
jgi:thymidylate kinase